ncbi:hypothetical protein KVR01_011616 [Diaporthe batatas]|uniref:uncharacterized protein n=1 Tax=Diaporthe batatas TaxID=748121 RepID=UPI001D04358C|nr:uncharacterized protein KVR01_011616 [Diaporthe batatas]KAG8158494.1 hypothetical protein KVR01_011616 [Diaporthe batatas]
MDPFIKRDAQDHVLDESFPNFNTPILRLTPALRRRIYLSPWLNVLVRYPTHDGEIHDVLNLSGRNYQPSLYQPNNPAHKLGIYGLLVCCRTIYAEVSALLYSSNRFVIRYWEKQSLSPLLALTPSSLSSLTHVKIVLRQGSCHSRSSPAKQPEDYRGFCDVYRNASPTVPGKADPPLDLHQAKSKALLDEWKSAAEHISRHIGTDRLELCIVCDMGPDDLEGAKEVLEPLKLFPRLRNCHIRLSRDPSPQLQRMAYDMVLKSRGPLLPDEVEGFSQTKPRIGSRLLALPRELRLHILSYTDLITPWKEVEWSRECNDDGKYLVISPGCSAVERGPCNPRLHHGCQFWECWWAHNRLSKPGIGCFCKLRHAASSSTCICWTPPTALFLVNRTLLHDAQVVFFSGNRFVVHDFQFKLPWSTPGRSTHEWQELEEDESGIQLEGPGLSEYHSDQLAPSMFLRKKVPHQMLRELRELEFVFPPYVPTGWPGEGHRAIADWAETLCWARDKLNLPVLTLSLVMSNAQDDRDSPLGRKEITSDQVEAILSAYRRIASPITVLAQTKPSKDITKLRGFYADVTWPWHSYWVDTNRYMQYGTGWVWDLCRKEHRELSEGIERLVLGKRDNETHTSSREKPWISVWHDLYIDRL